MAQATIRDVAREAAVSVASVSRVLNGHDNVRPALRNRVEAAAAALGYVMHAGARSLSLARSNAIGVVLPDLHGEFFSEVLRGMDRAASARGLQLLLSNMHHDPDRAAEALRSMRGRVDGMIVMAPHIDPDRLFAQLPVSMPAMLVNCAPHHDRRAELRVDNVEGAAAMTRHLIETGRRRIVHIAGPAGNSEAQERVHGYQATMAASGLVPRVMPGDFREGSGAAAAETLLADIGAVDAVFAANDMMAIGALMAGRRMARSHALQTAQRRRVRPARLARPRERGGRFIHAGSPPSRPERLGGGRRPGTARGALHRDMLHTWVASDFIRSALDLFTYDRPADATVILAVGLNGPWLAGEGSRIAGLRTIYNRLDLHIRGEGDRLASGDRGHPVAPGALNALEEPHDRYRFRRRAAARSPRQRAPRIDRRSARPSPGRTLCA